MSKILIVYGSTTGNTESIAEALAKSLQAKGHEASVENASSVKPRGLAEGYDALLLGCSAWGDDEVELQDDFVPIVDDFAELGVNGKKVAAFASGDSSFTHFCPCVDVVESLAEQHGATVITSGLRVEGNASAAPDEIEEFALAVSANL